MEEFFRSPWGWVSAAVLAGVVAASCAQGKQAGGGSSVASVSAAGGGEAGAGGAGGGGGAGGATATGGAGRSGGEGGASTCDAIPCGLLPPCGCPDDEMCVPVGQARQCAPAGDLAVGEACGSCAPGLHCIGFVNAPSSCHPFCNNDGACLGPGGRCALSIGDAHPRLCSPNCNPITSTGCTLPQTKCEPVAHPDFVGQWLTLCAKSGAGQQASACDSVDDCAPGHGCFGVNGQEACRRFCDRANPSCADCLAFDPVMVVGSIEYGACL